MQVTLNDFNRYLTDIQLICKKYDVVQNIYQIIQYLLNASNFIM